MEAYSTPQPQSAETRPKGSNGLIISLLFHLLLTAAAIFVYDVYFAQKVVVLDIEQIVTEQKRAFIEGKISEAELLATVDKIQDAIHKQNKNTVIILMESARVKNAQSIAIDK